MAVTAFDGSFSFKQDSLARLGERANKSTMSEGDMAAFQNSPFMQSMRKIEELTFQKMSVRDKKRQQTDPTFKPSDEDFEAAKSFKYDKCMNYYKTVGVDEFEPQKGVKDAYKRLSLVYHPDKTSGLPSEVKEEYALIFIEIKNAYQTLVDNPTRRQYDRDRDKDRAAAELNGWKIKERAQFDATEVLKKLAEERVQKKPSKIVDLSILCRLEKFYYGGHKGIKRARKIKNKMGWLEEERMYRIDVPAGRAEPFMADFRRQGDHHEDQHADTIRFSVKSKKHERVERRDNDLHVKSEVPLEARLETLAYISTQVSSIRGRQVLLWGLNPFLHMQETGKPELKVRIKGEGLGDNGELIFTAKAGAAAAADAEVQKAPSASAAVAEQKGDGRVVVTIKHLMTEAELVIKVNPVEQVGDIRKQCMATLNLGRSAMLKLLKPLGGGKFTPYPDSTPLGQIRQFVCGGTEWYAPTMNTEKSLAFLKKVLELHDSPQTQALLASMRESKDKDARADLFRQSQEVFADLLPDYGLKPTEACFNETLLQAAMGVARAPEGAQLRTRLEAVKAAWDEARKGSPKGGGAAGATQDAATSAKVRWEPGPANAKKFLQHFNLSPNGGFKEREVPASMKRRLERRARKPPVCEVVLQPLGGPVTLHTKPGCQLHFYTNVEGSSEASSSRAAPGTLFAVCLASQACSRGKLRSDWDRLKYKLMPLLQASCFKLLRMSRAILPMPIAAEAAFSSHGEKRKDPEDGNLYTYPELCCWYAGKYSPAEIDVYWENNCERLPTPPTPWKRCGDVAFKNGNYWIALNCYSQQLEELPKDVAMEESSRVLSNRSGCFAKVKEYGLSLQDARMATKLQPRWAKPWSRVGFAAGECGSDEDLAEARAAYFKAVELEPCEAYVKALFVAVQKAVGQSAEDAHMAKELGNEAFRGKEWKRAVAAYTEGLAQLPPEAFNTESDDQLVFLRAVLLCNRSAAFTRLRNWIAAVADAEEATEAKKGFPKAHCRLGVALLGARRCEEAYINFAKCLAMNEDYPAARKGRNECLKEMLRWRSLPAEARLKRRLKDAQRAKGTTRVFAICDVHFDHKVNEDWSHAIDDGAFQDDVLIIAGDLAGTKGAVVRGLTTLRAKFRRVFYTVGHHEMWVHYGEHERYPDSIAKLHGIFAVCDELGVDVAADAVAEDVFIVPIHSWYNAEFDVEDPWPDANDRMDTQTRWPMDPDDQVWKYMLKLNEGQLGLPFHGTVITFSHFLPRRNLPVPTVPGHKTIKTSGCERIDDLVRGVRSKLHVFGHSHERFFAAYQGVTYVNQPLGYSTDQVGTDLLPMLMVYDGRMTCSRPWDISTDRPH